MKLQIIDNASKMAGAPESENLLYENFINVLDLPN
jgi:hypothetical protein